MELRKITALISVLFAISGLKVNAQTGDTVVVQTFTFGSPQNNWFVFPSDTVRFEKVLMQYTLKCNPATNPACGEWDTGANTYVYDHTGQTDSSLVNQPIYTLNGAIPNPATTKYMKTPTYSYFPRWQYSMVHTGTTSFNSYIVGNGSTAANHPFGASAPVSRSQYLWTASELSGAGLSSGNISGLQFFVQTLGSDLKNLTIRIKQTNLSAPSQSTLNPTGFTTVYSKNTTFTTVGWNSLQFLTPFNWNGTSNVLVEITYDNPQTGIDNVVASTESSLISGLVNTSTDRSASFHVPAMIEVPLNEGLKSIDSAVSVAFWAYGTPEYQPQQGDCFEAVDNFGSRIIGSHTPWSDGNVYWDAGNYSGYDRINKAATAAQTEGQWNHWVYTKNVATGSMKIYLNGALWHSGTGKNKPMQQISKFRIGAGLWSAGTTYEGKMDEFAVFNKELSLPTIKAYMNKQIDAAHPNYNDLVLYYQFNDGNYATAADVSPLNNAPAVLVNGVDNPLRKSSDLVFNFTETTLRPNITFEQGVYTSHKDSALVVDSVMKTPIQLITYTDSVNNPGIATDTLTVWPTYYNNYVYNAQGVATDSTLVAPDSTINLVYYDWYRKFPQVLRYEIARFITPYGNNLSLGNGWTWTYDVSDYRTLLADSVHLSESNRSELLDLKFLMIKGIPPRDVVGIRNLWNGSFKYGVSSDPIESHLQALNVSIPANALNTRWKSRVTGHGMDSPENCAEFCAKTHYYKVNGTQRFSKSIWRDNCDLNPLFPQGGTWAYDRANWCPGAEVTPYDFELSPFATPGTTISLDHDVQSYVSGGPWNSYDIEDQLVSYGAPNFTLDAAIEDILSPSTNQMWLRYNPICTNPVIRIKNTGSTTLTSLTITYGLKGATPSVYNWTGNLPFMQTKEITLGNFNWSGSATEFNVTISNPNGGTDQYAANNSRTSKFTFPPLMPAQFVIELKTNNYPFENQYQLKDAAGTVIHSRSGLAANKVYKDTLNLPEGCYEFEMTDSGEDGLTWWANSGQGAGTIKFTKVSPATVLKNFNSDFGGRVYQQFTVGLSNGINDYIFTKNATFNIYPNPSNGMIYINIDLAQRNDGKVEITDIMGKIVYTHDFKQLTAESLEVNLSTMSAGVYFASLKSGNDFITKKIIIE